LEKGWRRIFVQSVKKIAIQERQERSFVTGKLSKIPTQLTKHYFRCLRYVQHLRKVNYLKHSANAGSSNSRSSGAYIRPNAGNENESNAGQGLDKSDAVVQSDRQGKQYVAYPPEGELQHDTTGHAALNNFTDRYDSTVFMPMQHGPDNTYPPEGELQQDTTGHAALNNFTDRYDSTVFTRCSTDQATHPPEGELQHDTTIPCL
jgi:hypothetical protein